MQINTTFAEGLTLVVLPDETKKEKVNVLRVKAVDSSKKSELQLINTIMYIVMLASNSLAGRI